MIRLHDTLAGEKVEFTPRRVGQASIYVCGPTVYEVPHVGHGRTALVYDTIRRYLTWRGLTVTYVSNVTDVEDKIIDRAAREGADESDVAKRYEDAYWLELDRLGVARPDDTPHATQFIEPMTALIAELVAGGHAYVSEGLGVYFDVASYPGYGRLSGRRLDDLENAAGARVAVEPGKRSPVDFALWKAAKPGEPAWESPWGPGRPGWHIECSAMSLDILGEGFDIHGGGDDLVFPHHENERAQAEAAGHPFARHWIHSGMVTVSGEKMSKSLGNYTTLGEALDAYGPRAFRLAALQTHYRSATELGPTELQAAARAVERLDALVRRAAVAGAPAAAPDAAVVEAFTEAMDDDFHTPAALACMFDAVGQANVAVDDGDVVLAAPLVASVVELAGVLGIDVQTAPTRVNRAAGSDEDGRIENLVGRREEARATRDFATADRLRAELLDAGVVVEDTPHGPVWRR